MAARSEKREQFLADIISTAVEGGIGYWSQCSHYQWVDYSNSGNLFGPVGEKDPSKGTCATVHVLNADESGYVEEGLEITVETVARGLGLIKSPEFGVNSRMRGEILVADVENDAGMIDSDDADVIVQAGLFGEVIYG